MATVTPTLPPVTLSPRAQVATRVLAHLLGRWQSSSPFSRTEEILDAAADLAVKAADALLARLDDDGPRPAA
jgi:hypothetical protein